MTRGAGRVVLGVVVSLLAAGCGGEDGSGDDVGRWRLDYVSASREMYLSDVVAVSADEGWAVATENDDDSTPTYTLLHRDGARWRGVKTSKAMQSYYGAALIKLAASGPDDVWLFGRFGEDAHNPDVHDGAMHWDGHRWSSTTADFAAREAVALAPDDVWAIDESTPEPTAQHWDGREWTEQPLPAGYFGPLAASGPDDVWAVGSRDDQPAALHFDGTRWQPVEVPEYHHPGPEVEESAGLTNIVSISPDDAWAFGTLTTTTAGSNPTNTPFAVHWDGSAWTKAPDAFDDSAAITPSSSALLATGDGAGGFVLASVFGSEQHHGRDGRLTRIEDPEPVPGRTNEITDEDRRQHLEVRDLELVPGTREVWAVGAVGVSPAKPGTEYARGVVASFDTTR